MKQELLMKNLSVPTEKIDVILDTDAFNEIDDQFAISYLIRSEEKCNVRAIYAAPFLNINSTSPQDGMEKSYNEILKLLTLAEHEDLKTVTKKGSDRYLPDEKTPIESDAAKHLAELAATYSPENPLYVVEIAAITTVASAILLNPSIAENIVIVWLGGHALSYHDTKEFNMMQDIAAARVIWKSGAPLVQLPCMGVVDAFRISRSELSEWLLGKNPLADYLASYTISEQDKWTKDVPWTRVIWDVTAVAWLFNENERFLQSRLMPKHLPNYDYQYNYAPEPELMRYVYNIHRDELMKDLIEKLTR